MEKEELKELKKKYDKAIFEINRLRKENDKLIDYKNKKEYGKNN